MTEGMTIGDQLSNEESRKLLLAAIAPPGTVPMGGVINREDMVELSKDEQLRISRRMADTMGTVEELKAEKAAISARIKSLEEQINGDRNIVKFGRDFRQVACHQFANFTTSQVTVVRLDNGAVISTRAMDAQERQLELDLDDKKPADEAADVSQEEDGQPQETDDQAADDGEAED